MSEEKKEAVEKKEEPKTEVKPDAKPESKPQERIKASACAKCNKALKHRKWFYRNGKFYCNKRCYREATQKVA